MYMFGWDLQQNLTVVGGTLPDSVTVRPGSLLSQLWCDSQTRVSTKSQLWFDGQTRESTESTVVWQSDQGVYRVNCAVTLRPWVYRVNCDVTVRPGSLPSHVTLRPMIVQLSTAVEVCEALCYYLTCVCRRDMSGPHNKLSNQVTWHDVHCKHTQLMNSLTCHACKVPSRIVLLLLNDSC